VLDRNGNLVRISAKIASHALKAKANVYVLDNKGNLVRINAKVALGDIVKANAKVYVIDQNGNLLRATAKANVGEPNGLKAKVGAKVGTNGVDAKVGLTLGGPNTGNPGGNPGGPGSPGSSAGIADQLAHMSPEERKELKKKCGGVLASPASYNSDTILVCRVLAQLTGL
jgi:hypothetical protein